MSDEQDDDCAGTIHQFVEVEGQPHHPEQRCRCGTYTWGYMDEMLTLTNIWEAS